MNTPINIFDQEQSSPNHICSLGPTTFLTSGLDKGVRLWDLRQKYHVIFFENIHYDQINSLEKISPTVFATASNDGNLNVSFNMT